MKLILKILAICILVVLQLTLFSKFEVYSSIPNFVLMISLALLFRGFTRDAFLVAIFGGLFVDLASPLRFGAYTITMALVLLGYNYSIVKNVGFLNPFFIAGLFIGAFFIIDLLFFLYLKTVPGWQIIVDAVLSGLLTFTIYFLLSRMFKTQEEIKII